jgi:hypothetical protein
MVESKEKINNWYRENIAFGLIINDKWFGKPMDNAHQLTWVEERKNKIIIEIDEQLYLLITKPFNIILDGNDLKIKDFKQLTFDRQGYGDMTPHVDIYSSGNLTLVGYK